MYLRHHIAHRFLTDAKMTDEVLRTQYPEEVKMLKGLDMTQYKVLGKDNKFKRDESVISNLYQVACLPPAAPHIPHHAFYITDTVLDNLIHIKVDRKSNGHYDWTVFKDVPAGKTTFIFKKNWLLRMQVIDGVIFFLDVRTDSIAYIFVDRLDQSVIDPKLDLAGADFLEDQFYKLLLFFYFSKNEERIVEGGKRYGSKKQAGALDNSTDIPVTIVNCNWNITSIRLTGFDVAGHMRMQACRPGMKDHRLIFVQPYKKEGYVRHAIKQAA